MHALYKCAEAQDQAFREIQKLSGAELQWAEALADLNRKQMALEYARLGLKGATEHLDRLEAIVSSQSQQWKVSSAGSQFILRTLPRTSSLLSC